MGGHRVCLFGVALLTTAISFAAWAQPRQVNGVLGGSVLLSPALPLNKTVKEMEWTFSDGDSATIRVAEFGPGSFERPDPKDQFKDRLEMFNEMVLKTGALEQGDSRVYGARIKLQPALVEDQFFNLSISEPLPDPEIRSWLLLKSPAWCHLMLQCHIPSTTGGTVIWIKPQWAFTDALHFALALPGCPFRPAPRVAGTSLAVTCQEPQPVPMARCPQPQWLWQRHVLTGMMTLGLIPSPSPGSHGHPDIPAEDRASGISRHDCGGVTDPAALLGVSQSPEPAPSAFSPPSQTIPREMLPVSSFTQGPQGMSSTVMLHLGRDVPACRTPQCQLTGRRIWQEEAPALHKS